MKPRDHESFPYADHLPPAWHVQEAASAYRPDASLTERHLHCVWADDKLRPTTLTDDCGEPVEVVTPGRWNLEAGPDFLDAVLLVGVEKRLLAGDVEIHIHPHAWIQHRHANDPAYARVVAHVTYLPGPRSAEGLPPSVLRVALRDALHENRSFAFDDIDLSAYPHATIPPTPRPCALALGADPDRGAALLLAAGRHRLERKRQRMAAHIGQSRDPRQTFYEAFLAALGYKLNTQAFRRLAQLLPLADWPEDATPLTHYGRLLRTAGLLPDTTRGEDDASRALIRELWDLAWRNPVPTPDPPLTWRLGALRPANHPTRRLAAAAAIFGASEPFEALWTDVPTDPPKLWFQTVMRRLIQRAELDCWRQRLTLTRLSPSTKPMAMLGATAAATLVTNVVVPFLICLQPETADTLLPALPTEEINAPMRATAAHLFGRDHNPVLYATSGLMQQGLLQIHADFCLNAHSGCANCALAAALGPQPL